MVPPVIFFKNSTQVFMWIWSGPGMQKRLLNLVLLKPGIGHFNL
eukprot:SAG22_NODE_366_length_11615_cov_13.379125_5_plen_44_part_00